MQFEIETPRLILKVLKADSAHAGDVLQFYLNDQEYFETYEPDRIPNYYTLAFQKNVLKFEYNAAIKGSHIRYYVFRREMPNRIIGTVCFHEITHGYYCSCELGYKFSTAYQHQGYAKEAINYALYSLFENSDVHKVYAYAETNNMPSIRLLDKLGFQREGINRDFIKLHGKWMDHYQYTMINPLQI